MGGEQTPVPCAQGALASGTAVRIPKAVRHDSTRNGSSFHPWRIILLPSCDCYDKGHGVRGVCLRCSNHWSGRVWPSHPRAQPDKHHDCRGHFGRPSGRHKIPCRGSREIQPRKPLDLEHGGETSCAFQCRCLCCGRTNRLLPPGPYYSNPALLNLLILAVIFVGLTAPLI